MVGITVNNVNLLRKKFTFCNQDMNTVDSEIKLTDAVGCASAHNFSGRFEKAKKFDFWNVSRKT